MPMLGGPQTPSPMSAPLTLKRPFSTYDNWSSSAIGGSAREIRPKPSSIGDPYGQPTSTEQPPKKKRGRPTKAEALARAEAHAVGGEAGHASLLQPPPALMIEPPVFAGPDAPTIVHPPAEEARPSLPAVTRMPISSILTPTAPTSASQSSSSSGKMRRGRSTRSEPEGLPTGETAGTEHSQGYESPYARMTGGTQEDTPARTAVRRHRDESELHPPGAPAPQPPPPDPNTR